MRTGSYLSPHLTSYAERIRIGDADVSADDFAAAIQRTAAAAAKVDRTLTGASGHPVRAADRGRVLRARAARGRGRGRRGGPGRPLGRDQRARRRGGRADQRRSGAHALARPDDRGHRGREARGGADGATLVLGDDAPEVVEALADGRPARRSSRPAALERPATAAAARGGLPGYQRRNFAAAAPPPRRSSARPLDAGAVAAAAGARVPGRLQVVAQRPADDLRRRAQRARASRRSPPPCPRARSRSCRSSTTRTRRRCCARCCHGCRPPSSPARRTRARSRPPRSPTSRARSAASRSEIEPDPRRAVERARELAGENGTVLATGSIYLVAEFLSAPGQRRASAL